MIPKYNSDSSVCYYPFNNDITLEPNDYVVVPITNAPDSYRRAIALSIAFQKDTSHINPVLLQLADPILRSRLRNNQFLENDKNLVDVLNFYKIKAETITRNDIEKDGTIVKIYKFADGKFTKDLYQLLPKTSTHCKQQVMLYDRSHENTHHFDVLLHKSSFQSIEKELRSLPEFSFLNNIQPVNTGEEEIIHSETMNTDCPKNKKKLKEKKIINLKIKENESKRVVKKSDKVTKTLHSKATKEPNIINIKNSTVNIFQKTKLREITKVACDRDAIIKNEMKITKNDPQNKCDIKSSNIIDDGHYSRVTRSKFKSKLSNPDNAEEIVYQDKEMVNECKSPFLAMLAEEPYLAEIELDLNIPVVHGLPSDEYFHE